MISLHTSDFPTIRLTLSQYLSDAPVVNVGEWQARVGAAEGVTIELQDVGFRFPIPVAEESLAAIVEPNLPWAEDHFKERVSGKPLNPPPSNAWWPFNVAGNVGHMSDEKFSHTYPERLWPKYAGESWWTGEGNVNWGVRYDMGDLSDLVRLFDARPDTRQGYVPIWFPEDTGAAHGERVPCTLGYHMMQRNGQLTIRYYLRSCDFVRHFVDDVYMAARLCQWVCKQVVHEWVPGDLIMYISSLHAFASDRDRVREDYNREMGRRLHEIF